MTTIKIRQAKPLDASNIARLLIECHEEGSAYPPVDHTIGLRWITRTLEEGYVLVADVSGRLVGTLALTNYQFPWSPKWYMYLEWLYVQNKFRKGGAFEALLTATHAHADEVDAPIVAGVSAADARVILKDKMFQHHGYQYLGGDFIRSEASGRQEKAEADSDVHATVMG
jgi:N-acetylglutamate synthase-like GNAT family acetyltransferase